MTGRTAGWLLKLLDRGLPRFESTVTLAHELASASFLIGLLADSGIKPSHPRRIDHQTVDRKHHKLSRDAKAKNEDKLAACNTLGSGRAAHLGSSRWTSCMHSQGCQAHHSTHRYHRKQSWLRQPTPTAPLLSSSPGSVPAVVRHTQQNQPTCAHTPQKQPAETHHAHNKCELRERNEPEAAIITKRRRAAEGWLAPLALSTLPENARAGHRARGHLLGTVAPRTCAEIDVGALINNAKACADAAAKSGTRVMAVVKADAYGHGAAVVARVLHRHCGIDFFAVATLPEALELRVAGLDDGAASWFWAPPCPRSGPSTRALIWNWSWSRRPPTDRLAALQPPPKPIKAHVMLNTGMNRIGLSTFDSTTETHGVKKIEESRPSTQARKGVCSMAWRLTKVSRNNPTDSLIPPLQGKEFRDLTPPNATTKAALEAERLWKSSLGSTGRSRSTTAS